MVFEYADSGTLRHYLSASVDLDWLTRCKLGINITSGLRYLHKLDILHKDLVTIDIIFNIISIFNLFNSNLQFCY